MRTEHLTKCCEPLQKMRVGLEPCKTGIIPSVVLFCFSFQGDTSVVVLFFYVMGSNFCAV